MAFWHSDSPLRAVEEWLRDGGAAPSPDGSQQWKCTLEGASEAAVAVRLDQGWLVFTTVLPQPPAPPTRPGAWPLLLRNGALPPGPGRIAWPFGESAPHVRCDLLLGEEGPRAITDACRGLAGMLQALRAAAAGSGPGSPGARPAENAVDAQRLCAEAGWPGIERAGGRVAVALEVPGLFHEAILAPTAAGGMRAHVELGVAEYSDIGREAAARFLLAVSAVVRLVRPSAVPVDGGFELRYEAAWAVAPSPAALASSLEALSVACRACAREVKALRDDAVAAAYVSRHERTPPHPGPASPAARGDACGIGRHTTPATTRTARSNGGPPVVAQRRELQR